ncbi:hypothetical protein Taro_054093 [Colocasia esculenta]|uniref:N-acetyltransferase domain-containing protein n=1 Tax=Colocasia esculenta TaxID=4460 RepID=A0A843XPG6_COLES|nr:hypothetical protein [Colocasia esculenta]
MCGQTATTKLNGMIEVMWETLPTTSYRCKNVGAQCKDNSTNIEQSSMPGTNASKLCELAFGMLQINDEEISKDFRQAFGRFVAREAVVDEEYWSASWLRAEAHWESMSYMRHIDSYKRKYAEQLKASFSGDNTSAAIHAGVLCFKTKMCWTRGQPAEVFVHCDSEQGSDLLPCFLAIEFESVRGRVEIFTWYAAEMINNAEIKYSYLTMLIPVVKKEDPNVRRTVLNSVVGTLDISIRQFLHGEKFPGVFKRTGSVLASYDDSEAHRYAYIANVCVSKFARRQGIASNMLHLGTDIAISSDRRSSIISLVQGSEASDVPGTLNPAPAFLMIHGGGVL